MEVNFTTETEEKLRDIALQRGFGEPAQSRQMQNSRYHDLKSGTVKPIPDEEVEAFFREKSAAARSLQPGS
jgi:hypothetical protein